MWHAELACGAGGGVGVVDGQVSQETEYNTSMTTFQTIATVIHILLLVGFVGAFAYLFDLV